jgi:hypothetical protein
MRVMTLLENAFASSQTYTAQTKALIFYNANVKSLRIFIVVLLSAVMDGYSRGAGIKPLASILH